MSLGDVIIVLLGVLVVGFALGLQSGCDHIWQKHTNGWGDDVFGPRRQCKKCGKWAD